MLCNHPGGGKVDMYNSGGVKKGYNDSLRQYVFAIHTMQVETKRTKMCDCVCVHVHPCIFRGVGNGEQLERAKMTQVFFS